MIMGSFENYLKSAEKQFLFYKSLADKSIAQIDDLELFKTGANDSNSIAIIMKHIAGNLKSRFTNFLSEDGEKSWRNREKEFEIDLANKELLIDEWESAWRILFETLNSLSEKDENKLVYIRNIGHTIIEALNRQICHYAYHVGQIVYIAKSNTENWKSLSIPKGGTDKYNRKKFSQPKKKGHFTDEFLNSEDK